MDRNVNLNLNILMSFANRDDPGGGLQRKRTSHPQCECLRSRQTVCRALCKPEVIIFARYQGRKRFRAERVSDSSARGPSFFQAVKRDSRQMTRRGCASGAAPRKRVSQLFCCVACLARGPVTTRHDVPRSARVMSETLLGGQRSLCGTLPPLKKKALPHLGRNVPSPHFTAHRLSCVKRYG